ncbi:hypothetical protein R5W23_003967 [Gemmata sp. JC673]|uniref:DUF4351 domain-containing protein n=1 Tax=Gemmata algarum TaxID=2975278 RepID=A0ABU5F566_9BACT|nr:hypothetical protein [Gemmata algarum]MDY3562501.1 hypothetical protein [Gemmata algarum]
MAKPFDATLNSLIDLRPGDWAGYFAHLTGIPSGPWDSLDTDLATTLQADRLFRINGPKPALLHLELEANHRLGVPRELLRYNTLIDHLHDLPVETVLAVLRPKALASDQNGLYTRTGVNGGVIAQFRYRVERVWERDVAYWLRGGIGLAPLALLTDEAGANLESAFDRFNRYLLNSGADATTTTSVLGSSFVLCGLRYEHEQVAEMYRRLGMLLEDSTTYQALIREGRERGLTEGRLETAHSLLIRQGTKKFGPPTGAAANGLSAISDLSRLERIADRMLEATGWDDLLQTA